MLVSTRKRNSTAQRSNGRNGIVLLVVIAMLALFATVGLTFVYYSESVAFSARINRIGVTSELRDIPPDRIMSQTLSQILFGTEDQVSKFYGTSLGQNMYGGPGGRFAYSGSGYNLDPKSGVTLDQTGGTTANSANFASQAEVIFGKVNAPYTFPDMNNPYLGAIDGNGNIIYRSYFRSAQPWYNPNAPTPVAQFNAPTGVQSLRAAGLPPLPNAYEGDVKNVMGATSVKLPDGIVVTNNSTGKQVKVFVDGTMLDAKNNTPVNIANGTPVTLPDGKVAIMNNGTTSVNESIWMDPNISGQTKEGISYKILVAPFIVDLDGRVNLSTAGSSAAASKTGITSRWALGPWEVNPLRLNDPADTTIPLPMTSANLQGLINNGGMPSRFNNSMYPFRQKPINWLAADASVVPTYSYYPVTGNEANLAISSNPLLSIPNNFPATWSSPASVMPHPAMFDWHNGGVLDNHTGTIPDRRFAASNAEALLRYNETGSPALTSDVLRNMPGLDFAKPSHQAIRNLVTPYSMSVDVPHLPWCLPTPGNYAFPVTAQGAVNAVPSTAPQTNNSSISWSNAMADQMLPGAMLSLNGAARFNLNQPITNPTLQAQQLFVVLRNITGLRTTNPITWKFTGSGYTDPTDTSGASIDLPTYRYLAQLAVNIVGYMDPDKTANNLTVNRINVFNWTGQQNDKDIDFVFGVEQPRLVFNEAYATWDNDGNDPGLSPPGGQQKKASWYRLNVFFELLNPTQKTNVVLTNGTPIYRVLVAKDTSGIDSNGTGKISAAGLPTNIVTDDGTNNQVIVSNWNVAQLGPNGGATTNGTGFMLVGPPVIQQPAKGQTPDNFLPPNANGSPKSKLPNRRPSFVPDNMDPVLSIKQNPAGGDTTKGPTMFSPTLVLQRLADPTLPFNDSITAIAPGNPPGPKGSGYNPWVTVDYFENIPYNPAPSNPGATSSRNSSIVTLGQNDVNPAPGPLNTFASYGRKQPLKAYPNLPILPAPTAIVTVPGNSAVVAQNPTPAPTDQQMPLNTFRFHNSRNQNPLLDPLDTSKAPTITIPFDWYIHLDRPLLNRGELLSVSTTSPVLLTHRIGAPGWTLGEAMASPNTLLARLLESTFVPSLQYNAVMNANAALPPGSVGARPLVRVPGKVNLNTAFSTRIFEALFDPQNDSSYQSYQNGKLVNNSYFTNTDVDQFYTLFDMYRKNTYPGNQGNPTGPVAGFSDFYYTGNGNAAPRGGLLKMIYQSPVKTSNPTSQYYYGLAKLGTDAKNNTDTTLPPYARDEAIRKIMNNVTFTSNTFAVWLTVGFFETRTVNGQSQLVELFSDDNRQIRHRMFAIVDRSQMVMPDSSTPLNPVPGQTPPLVGITVQSVSANGPTPGQYKVSNYVSYVLGVGSAISGRVAGNFGAPVGIVSMDWKFTVGGSIQIGDPIAGQVGTIVAVTPSTTAGGMSTIEVAFPKINGKPPVIPPKVGDPIRFPSSILNPALVTNANLISRMPTPFSENSTFQALSSGGGDLKSLQYGYPGPQLRFNVADYPMLVPYYSIID